MQRDAGYSLSKIVIFQSTPGKRNGIKDFRLVRVADADGTVLWL
jgi:hypothetical protein